MQRWTDGFRLWRTSSILASVWPCAAAMGAWCLAVSAALPHIIKRKADHTVPLNVQGAAIGLLLVFRTNEAYRRLAEARELWGRLGLLTREVASKAAASWEWTAKTERTTEQPRDPAAAGSTAGAAAGMRSKEVANACRYLAAFTWSLRDELRSGAQQRGDILTILLPGREAQWVAAQGSRPLAILWLLRRLFYGEAQAGRISANMHLLVEEDIQNLDNVVASCDRLFTSPIPPTMSRHGTRSLFLWLLAQPLVLAWDAHPAVNALWLAATTFIYMGIDELGVQVEQPFKIMPLWQLAHGAMDNIEGALSTPEVGVRAGDRVRSPVPNW
mmetsp:Transcript_31357/g.70459  ORF Transcript_31357/g.70459 Transcript_31357/m.70459 type:complete len:329 (-) Transcript_31357:240-1226(-)